MRFSISPGLTNIYDSTPILGDIYVNPIDSEVFFDAVTTTTFKPNLPKPSDITIDLVDDLVIPLAPIAPINITTCSQISGCDDIFEKLGIEDDELSVVSSSEGAVKSTKILNDILD